MPKFALPVLLAALISAPASALPAGAPDAETVTVELASFSFTPADLVFEHGRTYRLHLVNTSSGGHDFEAGEFFAASRIAGEDAAKIVRGRVDLKRGESADITIEPLQPGTYPLRCSHFMHGSFGMKGTITVR